MELAFRHPKRIFISLVASGRTSGTSRNQTYFRLRGSAEASKREREGGGREGGRDRETGRKRDGHTRSSEKRSSERCGFLRFTTFLIVWNSLSAAQIKEEKYSPRRGPIWTGFREHRATARSVAARAPGGDGLLGLQRQQFLSTSPLFNYTPARHSRGGGSSRLTRLSPPSSRVFPVRPIFAVPLLRRLRVSRLYSPFITYTSAVGRPAKLTTRPLASRNSQTRSPLEAVAEGDDAIPPPRRRALRDRPRRASCAFARAHVG